VRKICKHHKLKEILDEYLKALEKEPGPPLFMAPAAVLEPSRAVQRIQQREQASAGVLLGFAGSQIRTRFAVVGDGLFLARCGGICNPERRLDSTRVHSQITSSLTITSVVVKHFRDPTAVVNKLAEYEELYLPQRRSYGADGSS
jgi:hypothetical protein